MIGLVITTIKVGVLKELARRGRVDLKQFMTTFASVVKDTYENVVISPAYKDINDSTPDGNSVIFYNDTKGKIWLGRWASDTLRNNDNYFDNNGIATTEEEFIHRIKNYLNYKDNGRVKDRLREETSNGELGNEPRGVAIKNPRGQFAVTSGQVSYKAVHVKG